MPAVKNILILEDSPTAMALMQSALKNGVPDSVLHTATTVDAASRIAAAHEIHLFVLDVHLPDGTGLEFLTDMKMVHPEALAIVVTATPLPAYREYATRAGAVSFFAKPIQPAKFREYVNSLLQENQNEQGYVGVLRDLTVIDIVQLKCIGGATSAVEFGGPAGQKGLIVFHQGHVRHATLDNLIGVEAFNAMVRWPGGKFREIAPPDPVPQTIQGDWQMLLMEAVRQADEAKSK